MADMLAAAGKAGLAVEEKVVRGNLVVTVEVTVGVFVVGIREELWVGEEQIAYAREAAKYAVHQDSRRPAHGRTSPPHASTTSRTSAQRCRPQRSLPVSQAP